MYKIVNNTENIKRSHILRKKDVMFRVHLEFRALAVGMATTFRDDTVGYAHGGVSTTVSVMSVVQPECQFSSGGRYSGVLC